MPLIPITNLRSDFTKAVASDVYTIKVFQEDYEKAFFDTRTFNEVAAVVGNATREVMNAKKALKIKCEPIESTTATRDHFGQKWHEHTPAGLENTTGHYAQMEAMYLKKLKYADEMGTRRQLL